MNYRTFRTIQGCPVYADICPYIAVIVNEAGARVNSIYRGDEAAHILHKHGKHTQRELYNQFIFHHGTPANQPGRSTHELRGDGRAYPGRVGARLQWWQQGFDVNDANVNRCIAVARKHGWALFRPYHSGAEFHHLNFRLQPKRPRLGSPMWARFARIRLTYPTS